MKEYLQEMKSVVYYSIIKDFHFIQDSLFWCWNVIHFDSHAVLYEKTSQNYILGILQQSLTVCPPNDQGRG